MQAEVTYEPALFESTHAALIFAFNATRSTQGQSAMARLMGGPLPAGRGLGGLDGAAQAGFILCEVAALIPRLRGQIITARFAVRSIPCDCGHECCSGSRPNREWMRAIGEISDLVRTEALAGTVVNYTLRSIIVRRYFGVHSSLKDAADASGVDRDTASSHAAKVIGYLKDQERLARFEIDGKLKAAGIVE